VAPNLLKRREMGPDESLGSLARSGLPFGVLCLNCQHRRLVDPKVLEKRLGRRIVRDIRFRCSRCGMRYVALEKFTSPSRVKRFLRRD
jgi:hypothetical protein